MIGMIMTGTSDQVHIIHKEEHVTLMTIVDGVETNTTEAGMEEGEGVEGIVMIVTSTHVVQVIQVGPDDQEMRAKEARPGKFFNNGRIA